jgi:glycosyltransferase involved in cell wall biosynthesis
MIEAMACGTPVIVSSAGAASEIVDDGKTGFVCRSIGELVEGVRQLETLDRQECRRVVEERFSAERMAAEYADLYAEVVAAWPDHVRTKESASSRR